MKALPLFIEDSPFYEILTSDRSPQYRIFPDVTGKNPLIENRQRITKRKHRIKKRA